VPITRIGEFLEGEPGLTLLAGDDEVPLEPRAWRHLGRPRASGETPA
jgi:hypothetical protein